MNKQKIILFEGPDKCGKSTIAKELSKVLSIPYFKFVNHNYWDKSEYALATKFDQPFLAELLRQTEYSMILDRGYPSEYVYGKVFDRKIDMFLINRLDDMFSNLNTTIIICNKKDNKEPDENFSIDKYSKLTYFYTGFADYSDCNIIELDTTDQDLNKQIKIITERLKEIYND